MTANQPPEPTPKPERRSTDDVLPFVHIIHPAHLTYISDLHFNSLPYLLECLDAFDAVVRDHVLFLTYVMVIQPRQRPAVTGQETLRELYLDEVSYPAFEQKCQQIVASGMLDGSALTMLIVNFTLQYAFDAGNTTAVEQKIAQSRQHLEFLQTHGDLLLERRLSKAIQYAMVKMQEKGIRELPRRTREAYAEYVSFCEHVVARLLEEDPRSSLGVDRTGH